MFATIRTNSSPRAAAFSILAVFLGLPGATDVALAQDGLIGWGATMVFDSRLHEQTFVEVAAGGYMTLVRRSNGTLAAWGDNTYGACNVPALPPGLSYVEVATSWCHTVARRSDGSVVAWGN